MRIVTVDPATPADARPVAQIHVEGWQAAYRTIVPAEYLAALSIDERETMWRECIDAGVPELLVARVDGSVCGWVSFGACRDAGAPENHAEVWALYVAPAAWSTGVGRALWTSARRRMFEAGFKTCSLWAFPQNARAIGFYRSAGFALDASSAKDFTLGGAQLQEVRLVCDLSA